MTLIQDYTKINLYHRKAKLKYATTVYKARYRETYFVELNVSV